MGLAGGGISDVGVQGMPVVGACVAPSDRLIVPSLPVTPGPAAGVRRESSGGSPVDGARVFGVSARLPGRTRGGQDSHGQQNP